MNKTILSTEKLCKTFSQGGTQHHVLKNIDLKFNEGDFTVIMVTQLNGFLREMGW